MAPFCPILTSCNIILKTTMLGHYKAMYESHSSQIRFQLEHSTTDHLRLDEIQRFPTGALAPRVRFSGNQTPNWSCMGRDAGWNTNNDSTEQSTTGGRQWQTTPN
eukprot:7708853-Ditylum_brightwellii.AAC.1